MNKIETLIQKRGYKREHGFFSVIAALVGNFIITVFKIIGFLISGSSSLFSEAVHSIADTANQSLLLVGIIKSRRAPDEDSSYGYGLERFFWALISACGVFFIGAGITIYHGVDTLLHPETLTYAPVIFVILIVSFVLEFATFSYAFRELWIKKGWGVPFSEAFKNGDPTVIAVIYEDGVALLGILVAAAGIGASYFTGNPTWDAIGSIFIGLLLAWVAVVLILKNKRYLVEKSIPEDVKDRIIEMLLEDPMIERVFDFKSSVVELGKFRAKCEVEVNGTALFKELSNGDMLKGDYEKVVGDYQDFVRYLVDYTDRVPRVIGSRIDDLENRIKLELPAVRHIDIEIN